MHPVAGQPSSTQHNLTQKTLGVFERKNVSRHRHCLNCNLYVKPGDIDSDGKIAATHWCNEAGCIVCFKGNLKGPCPLDWISKEDH